MTPELYRACGEAVHVLTADGRKYKAARAVFFALSEIGYARFWVRLFSWPPLLWLAERGYSLVARHRDFFARFFFTRGQ